MDDNNYGTRNPSGDWRPNQAYRYAPLFDWPVSIAKIVKWMFGVPGYIFPWNAITLAISVALWVYLTPALVTTKTMALGWVLLIYCRNATLTLLWVGAFYLRLYVQRKQGLNFKYNGKWPDLPGHAFALKKQIYDNLIWSFASGVPI